MKSAAKKKPAAKAMSRGLGKGLSALMSENYGQAAQETQTQNEAAPKQTIALSQIRTGKFQPRTHFNDAAMQELTESVRKSGVMQPILVRPTSKGMYEIVAGERRWRAAQAVGLQEIPAVVREMDDSEALELALVENVQRENLHPLEEAVAYQRLADEFHYTQEAIAATVHKSRSHVANLLRLLDLPEEVRDLFTQNKLSMGHARALIGVDNCADLANKVVERGMNVRQTEHMIRVGKNLSLVRKPRQTKAQKGENVIALPPSADGYRGRDKDPDIMALEETLSENLGLKVSITDRGQSGEIMIAYESLEQLDEILRRLGGGI